MSASQRRKGARGELEAAAALRAIGLDAERSARNGVASGEDLHHAFPGARIEVKWCEAWRIPTWWTKLVYEAGRLIPVLMIRRRRFPWLMVIRVEDFPALAAAYAKAQGRPIYPEVTQCESDTQQP